MDSKKSAPYKNKNKSVVFFSASSVGDTKQLWDFGIREILVSYFYIKKGLGYYDDLLPKLVAEGGLFMTDSGGFSFMGAKEITEEMSTEAYWLPYLKEYVAWLKAHKEYIFVAANLDLDSIVGSAIVDKWNKEYFEPLEKEMNIVYVVHIDEDDIYDKGGWRRLTYYCKKYKYVGINQSWKKDISRAYQIAKSHGVRLHGFAWTELPLLKRFPMFSVDSTSWLSGVRYGTTYDYDGKNFRQFDTKKKDRVHKMRKVKYIEAGLPYDEILLDKRTAINNKNLLGWLGFRKEYLKFANIKLLNKEVKYYERRK